MKWRTLRVSTHKGFPAWIGPRIRLDDAELREADLPETFGRKPGDAIHNRPLAAALTAQHAFDNRLSPALPALDRSHAGGGYCALPPTANSSAGPVLRP